MRGELMVLSICVSTACCPNALLGLDRGLKTLDGMMVRAQLSTGSGWMPGCSGLLAGWMDSTTPSHPALVASIYTQARSYKISYVRGCPALGCWGD